MTKQASEALAALREQFQAQLTERVQAIRKAFDSLDVATWQADDAKVLHRLVHSLTGAAGTFGMSSVSEISRQLEVALAAVIEASGPADADSWSGVAHELGRLEGIVHIRMKSNAPSMMPRPASLAQPQRTPLVHLVEDDMGQAEFLRQRLVAHGFRVRHFADLADFGDVITAKLDEMPAAVVMDMMFPEGGSAGASIIEKLGLGAKVGIPVVFVSVRDEMVARLAAYRAGASRYLTKPVDSDQLCALLDDLTGRMPPDPFRVLMVDDDKAVLALHAAVLRQAGLEVLSLSEPLQCLDKLKNFAADVVVLDVYMPDASGPELAAVIREQGRYMNLPILFLSAEQDMSKQLLALNLGGDDFLVKPVRPDHLVSAVTARARRARQNTDTMQRLSITLYEREREHQALDQHALVSATDVDGNITYVNDAFCKVSGYAREEMLGKNHKILKSGNHSSAFYGDMWTTLRSGTIWRGEICNRRKDGTLYWVNATITPFLDGDGKVYQYVSIRSDITALKESQNTLRLSKERLRRGQIYANIGTWDWNIQESTLIWSERIAALFGHPEGELETTYDNFLAAVHPDDRQAVIDAVNACVERDVPYEIEHRVVWPDGTVRWLLERGAVVRDVTGKATQMLGVVQDVTERKLAQKQVELFQMMIEKTAEPMFLIDVEDNYRLSYANEAAAQHWGVPVEELLTWRIPDWDPTFDEEKTSGHFAEMASQTGIHMETQHHLKDGRTVPVEVFINARVIDGRRMIFGTFHNIEARQQAAEELRRAKEAAEAANRAKSEFLSSMSHELRTPMNAVLGFGQLLQYDDTLSAEHKDSVGEILTAGKHLLELINEVLDLAKVESGNIDLSLESVDVCPVLQECISLVMPLAAKRSIDISHIGLEGAALRADRTRLRQVLLNLLSNAVKYNREGGSIRVEARPQGVARLRILVTDTGPGVAAERLTELFEPFNRLGAEASTTEGTGIGLTITRRIVEMMGGTVDVESTLGVGSTFWIELPLEDAADTAGDAPQIVDPGDTPARPAAGTQHTVLYIEDNPSNIALMAQVLGRRPHIRLLTAHTPRLGIEYALAHRPEVILLDINMPDMDGYQVLAALKAQASLKDIPVIAVSANAMPSDIERGMAAGFADYLTKPFDIVRLYAMLDRLLLSQPS